MRFFSALAFLIVIGAASPALADAPDEALLQAKTSLLDGEEVVLLPPATLPDFDELSSVLEGTSIGVVVVPNSDSIAAYDMAYDSAQVQGEYVDSFAEAIYATVSEQYRTVIVIDDEGFSVASNQSTAQIEKSLAGLKQEDVSRIVLEVDRIEDINEYTPNEWVPIAIGGVVFSILPLIVFGAVTGRKKFAKYRSARAHGRRQREALAAALETDRTSFMVQVSESVPQELRHRLSELQAWTYREVRPRDPELADEVKTMISRFVELFERIEDRGSPAQARVTLVNARNMLVKVDAVLSDRYYRDLMDNPDLWDDADGRLDLIDRAVAAVNEELLRNIKAINASEDLDFQTSLRSLTAMMDGPNLDDLYGQR